MRRGEENSEFLPLDLVIEILLRLPSKSIARFCCVSKLWHSTLRGTNFTESFSTISSSRPKLLLTCLKDGKTFFSTSLQPPQSSSPLAANLQMSFPINMPGHMSFPVRGLTCGLNRPDVSVPVICNLSTGQFLTLPIVEKNMDVVKMCLGYDPINKQFKVLCMTVLYSRTIFSRIKYQVLTLETEGEISWRMIECDIPHRLVFLDSRSSLYIYDGICINGVCYYYAWLVDRKIPVIVCFDIRSEKFKFIRQTQGMTSAEFRTRKLQSILVNYKGKLAKLKLNTIDGICMGIQLWVLKDAEKHEWLDCIYNFPPPWNYSVEETTKLRCAGTTTTGEIVLLPADIISDSLHLLYYNPKRNTINKVEIQGMEAFKDCQVYTFLDHVEDVKDLKFYGKC